MRVTSIELFFAAVLEYLPSPSHLSEEEVNVQKPAEPSSLTLACGAAAAQTTTE